jgi:hypothetical protein
MHLENSCDRGRLRAPHGWARLTWGLLSAVLAACGTLKPELCTAVHPRVLEELRASDGMPRYVLDPWACEQNARKLHELSEALHALEIRDAQLHAAVEAYRVEVEHLSEDYGRLASAYQNSTGLSPEEARRVQAALSRGVLGHMATVNVLRAQVQSACNNL